MIVQRPDGTPSGGAASVPRRFVLGAALAAVAGAAGLPSAVSAQTGTATGGVAVGGAAVGETRGRKLHELPPLPYDYGALEPVIDRETMELHHNRHHRAYVDALNRALQPYPDLQGRSVEALLRDIDTLPAPIRETVRNNGGGHANHSMFWTIMQPGGEKRPSGALLDFINRSFGSFDGFKQRFEEAGSSHFGSGWVFLASRPGGRGLDILTLPNQDAPAMHGRYPLLGNDLWEHAYYLKHRNRKADYLREWWQVVNWTAVDARLHDAPT